MPAGISRFAVFPLWILPSLLAGEARPGGVGGYNTSGVLVPTFFFCFGHIGLQTQSATKFVDRL